MFLSHPVSGTSLDSEQEKAFVLKLFCLVLVLNTQSAFGFFCEPLLVDQASLPSQSSCLYLLSVGIIHHYTLHNPLFCNKNITTVYVSMFVLYDMCMP